MLSATCASWPGASEIVLPPKASDHPVGTVDPSVTFRAAGSRTVVSHGNRELHRAALFERQDRRRTGSSALWDCRRRGRLRNGHRGRARSQLAASSLTRAIERLGPGAWRPGTSSASAACPLPPGRESSRRQAARMTTCPARWTQRERFGAALNRVVVANRDGDARRVPNAMLGRPATSVKSSPLPARRRWRLGHRNVRVCVSERARRPLAVAETAIGAER